MKLAIMQPYLFPYLGYFQLIHAVDTFVVYDDVNFIKGGWINRNFILANGKKQLLTLPLKGASSNRLINQIEVGGRREKLLETLRQSYSKAPRFSKVFPLIEQILTSQENNLAKFLNNHLLQICDYLNIHTKWHISSDLKKETSLKGQDKVLAICEELGANHYINAPGGKDLYDRQAFERHGMKLSFTAPRPVSYCQLKKPFVANLSIVDVMMFNNKEQCTKLLTEYDLV